MSTKTDVWNVLSDPYYQNKQKIQLIAAAFTSICNVELVYGINTEVWITINGIRFDFDYTLTNFGANSRAMYINSMSYRLKGEDKWPLTEDETAYWRETYVR